MPPNEEASTRLVRDLQHAFHTGVRLVQVRSQLRVQLAAGAVKCVRRSFLVAQQTVQQLAKLARRHVAGQVQLRTSRGAVQRHQLRNHVSRSSGKLFCHKQRSASRVAAGRAVHATALEGVRHGVSEEGGGNNNSTWVRCGARSQVVVPPTEYTLALIEMHAGALRVRPARCGWELHSRSHSRNRGQNSRVRPCCCSGSRDTPPEAPEPLRLRHTALAAACSAVAGSLAAAPVSSLAPLVFSTLPGALSAAWELDQDTVRTQTPSCAHPYLRLLLIFCRAPQLAVTLLVFGAVGANLQQSSRVPLALACLVARVGAHVHPSATCTPTPLTCGTSYFDAAMLSDVAASTVAASAAFAVALGCLQALSARERV